MGRRHQFQFEASLIYSFQLGRDSMSTTKMWIFGLILLGTEQLSIARTVVPMEGSGKEVIPPLISKIEGNHIIILPRSSPVVIFLTLFMIIFSKKKIIFENFYNALYDYLIMYRNPCML